jgi:LAS superfamily LD-carboxypeptidase LdcB
VLGGGGYRSSRSQVELRISHCGGYSSYAIYQRPASQCRPPTARPGQSMHERGLAIDFTCEGGGTIRSHSSPCYQWLAAHGADYGLSNLPSEPWHWSTNGR